MGAKGKLYEFDNGLGFGLAAQYLRYDNRKVNNWRSEETGESASDLGWSTNDDVDFWQLLLLTDFIATERLRGRNRRLLSFDTIFSGWPDRTGHRESI